MVIHLAGLVGAKACRNVERALHVNILGTMNVIKLCKQLDCKLFFASTCSVYRAFKGLFDYYNGSKIVGEILSWMNGFKFLRFGTTYGGEKLNTDYLVDSMIHEALTKNQITVYNDVVRPIIHLEDLARAIVFAIEHPPPRFYELGSENMTKLDMAHIISRHIQADVVNVETEKKSVGYVANSRMLTDKGFSFKWSLNMYLNKEYGGKL